VIGNSEQVNFSRLAGAAEYFVVEVNFTVFAISKHQIIDKRFAILIGIGICEGKLYPIFLLEAKGKGKFWLISRVVLDLSYAYIYLNVLLNFLEGQMSMSARNRMIHLRWLVILAIVENTFLMNCFRR
jgi:hypothetical protein